MSAGEISRHKTRVYATAAAHFIVGLVGCVDVIARTMDTSSEAWGTRIFISALVLVIFVAWATFHAFGVRAVRNEQQDSVTYYLWYQIFCVLFLFLGAIVVGVEAGSDGAFHPWEAAATVLMLIIGLLLLTALWLLVKALRDQPVVAYSYEDYSYGDAYDYASVDGYDL